MRTLTIDPSDFDTSLDEFMGDETLCRAVFVDRHDDDGEFYTVRMQRQMGITRTCIDCIPQLDGRNAWQVPRLQPKHTTIGCLLLQIASAPMGTDARAFFGLVPA